MHLQPMAADVADTAKTIGGYLVGEHIGSGGMADVYLANHPVTNRRVALKVLKWALDGKRHARERFEREVRLLGALEHENIVGVLDAGVAEDARPFMVTEYVEGRRLDALVGADGTLAHDRACFIVLQVARALAHAHAAGIVHRDVKPGNILVDERAGRRDHVVLIDFGIAKMLDQQDPSLTSTGNVVGTPNYMAPEQARGDAELSSATDVYALGAILYELLCGERAHPGATRQAVLHHVLYHSVAPLAVSVREACPEVPSLVDRCLDRDARKRPPIDEVVEVLERSLLDRRLESGTSLDTLWTEWQPIRGDQAARLGKPALFAVGGVFVGALLALPAYRAFEEAKSDSPTGSASSQTPTAAPAVSEATTIPAVVSERRTARPLHGKPSNPKYAQPTPNPKRAARMTETSVANPLALERPEPPMRSVTGAGELPRAKPMLPSPYKE